MFTDIGNRIVKKLGRVPSIPEELKLKRDIVSKGASESYQSKGHEQILSSNRLERRERSLGGALGGSCLTKLKDDGYGVFKPYDRYEVQERKRFIQTERAAYLTDLLLGFDLVPPTVVRTLPNQNTFVNQVGSMQQFIENSRVGAELSHEERQAIDKDEVMKLELFDFMIQNSDRHMGNYLVKDGKIYAIDHGSCLGSEINPLKEDADIRECILSDNDPHSRSHLIVFGEFYERKIPDTTVAKLKAFAASEKEQIVYLRLMSELIEERYAAPYLDRILCIIHAINDSGMVDRKMYRENIEKEVTRYQTLENHLNEAASLEKAA